MTFNPFTAPPVAPSAVPTAPTQPASNVGPEVRRDGGDEWRLLGVMKRLADLQIELEKYLSQHGRECHCDLCSDMAALLNLTQHYYGEMESLAPPSVLRMLQADRQTYGRGRRWKRIGG